jgi:hypothetical protein
MTAVIYLQLRAGIILGSQIDLTFSSVCETQARFKSAPDEILRLPGEVKVIRHFCSQGAQLASNNFGLPSGKPQQLPVNNRRLEAHHQQKQQQQRD